MKIGIPFKAFAIAAASLGFSGSVLADNTEKLRLAVFSAMNKDTLDAFYEAIANNNDNVDSEARPLEIDETDVVVLLLDSWKDVDRVPPTKVLSPLWSKVKNLPDDAVRNRATATRSDGTKIRFIFYSLSATGYKSLACYAEDVAAVLRDDLSVLTSDTCQ